MLIYEHWLIQLYRVKHENETYAFITFVWDGNVHIKNHLWCFKIHASFVFMLQVNCTQTAYSNGQLANKFWSDYVITHPSEVGLATSWQNTNAYGTGYNAQFEFFEQHKFTSYCVCIIAAKLSVKLLCCLKDKRQRRDCLSRADCFDQSSRRHKIK